MKIYLPDNNVKEINEHLSVSKVSDILIKELINKEDYSSISISFDENEEKISLENVFILQVNIKDSAACYFAFPLENFPKDEVINKVASLKNIKVLDLSSSKHKTAQLFNIAKDYNPYFIIYQVKNGIPLYKGEVEEIYKAAGLGDNTFVFYVQKEEIVIEKKPAVVSSVAPVIKEKVDEGPVFEDLPVVEETVAQEEVPAIETPVEENVIEEAPIEEAKEEAPVEETIPEEPVSEEVPTEEIPVEETPVEVTPIEEVPTEETPVEEEAPVQEAVEEVKEEKAVLSKEEKVAKLKNYVMMDITNIKKNKYHFTFLTVSSFLFGFASSVGYCNAIIGKMITILFFVCAGVGLFLNTYVYVDYFKEFKIKSRMFVYSLLFNILGTGLSIAAAMIFYTLDKSDIKSFVAPPTLVGITAAMSAVSIVLALTIGYLIVYLEKKFKEKKYKE